jgi:hypothetical protein
VRRTLIAAFVAFALAALLAPSSVGAPPAIRAENVTAEATSAAGASVTFHVRAYDPDSGNPIAATCNPPGAGGSGDFDVTGNFPIGTTAVTCAGTQENGDAVSTGISVTVQDTTPPSFGPVSDIAVSTTGNNPIPVMYETPTATDLGQPLAVVCTPPSGSTFPIGTTPRQLHRE